jgi:hypothetical protein
MKGRGIGNSALMPLEREIPAFKQTTPRFPASAHCMPAFRRNNFEFLPAFSENVPAHAVV